MTNTIPNVPRELLERLHSYIPNGDGHNSQYANDLADAVVALEGFAAQSPAGADGLEVVGKLRYFMDYPDSPHSAPGYITHQFNPASWDHAGEAAGEHKLCRLSAAQAIIDGLRGEVDKLMTTFVRVADHLHIDCEKAKSAPGKPSDVFIAAIDQQAQRIGELAELAAQASVNCKNTAYYLRKYRPDLADICSGWCVAIDAALSAGKYTAS